MGPSQKARWRRAKSRNPACSRLNSFTVDAMDATNIVLINPASAIKATYIGISFVNKESYFR